MPHKKLVWKLFPYFLAISLISLLILGIFASNSLKGFYIGQVEKELKERAGALEDLLGDRISVDEKAFIDSECKKLGAIMSNRFTVILPDGTVVGDSEKDPDRMENHSDRPEILAALDGASGISKRYSYTVEEDMLYVAIPIIKGGKTVAVVRASNSIEAIDKGISKVYRDILLLGIVLLLIGSALALWLSNLKISRPLYEIKTSADKLAMGDLKIRVNVPYSEETEAISRALNKMAIDLDERISTITSQKNELEAVLKSMIESVLVVNTDERIMRLNETAGRLFGIDPRAAEGKMVQEAVRNTAIERFIKKTLDLKTSIQEEIVIEPGEEKILHASGSVLKGLGGDPIGILVVLNDITKIKRLENLRKDFVSNVSHELKTPITSIKGFIETLKEGAMDDPDARGKFLDIISSQSDRLAKIIDDLLSISKIEKLEETAIEVEETSLKEIIGSASTFCEASAKEKDISLKMSCPDDLKIKANPVLLEQAVTNLIDNAIKYSDSGKTVEVLAERKGGEIFIRVKDEGIGISKEHQDRIFERFYRVDKARSRRQGGTGLGLSIVKHIVHAHRGTITVESEPGRGSTFVIRMPA